MASLKSQYSSIKIPQNTSLVNFLLSRCTVYPERVALVDGISGEETKYGELLDYSRRVASALVHRGLQNGEVVAFCSHNSPHYVWAMLGAMRAGAVITGINPAYTSYEINHILEVSHPVVLFVEPQLLATFDDAKDHHNIREIYILGHACTKEYPTLADLLRDGGHCLPQYHMDDSDTALLPFSSGTTGKSKGIPLSHANVIANILQMSHSEVDMMDLDKEIWVANMPFYHMFGLHIVLYTCIYIGGTAIILPKFKLDTWLKAVQKYKVTFLHIVPPIAVLLAKQPVALKYNLTSARRLYVGGAPLGEEVISQVLKRLPQLRFAHAYGLTESTAAITMPTPQSKNYQAVGKLMSNMEGKVVDINTGRPLGPGMEGELLLRGPCVFKHYQLSPYNLKQGVDENGWLHTGDLVRYDQNEDFYIIDRLKELIKYNAFQVSPGEIEDLLLKHPDVLDVAVIGIPHERFGEVPFAFVVSKHESSVTETQIQQFVKNHLSYTKWLRGGVEFTDKIPKSPSGKILRRILRERRTSEKQSKL